VQSWAIRQWLRSTFCRWPVFLVISALCLAFGENYPFSNFPMYSSFAKNSYFIYLADAAGRPLATSRFGLTTPGLKKIFESQRRAYFRASPASREESGTADKTAGVSLLHYIEQLPVVQARSRALLRGLQVRRVNILWTKSGITEQTEVVAQHK
jgi:hypothetical protein